MGCGRGVIAFRGWIGWAFCEWEECCISGRYICGYPLVG